MFSNITGIIGFTIVVGTTAGFILSIVLNSLYKRAVIKGMGLGMAELNEDTLFISKKVIPASSNPF